MQLLRRISKESPQHLTELLSSAEIAQAEEYELQHWVILKRTKMSKGLTTYGQRTVYAAITDAGRRALEAAAV